MRLRAHIAFGLLTAAMAATGQVRLDGLRLGYAVDESTHGLRPLVGIPGSAYLGAPLALPFGVRSAVMRGGVAVVIGDGEEPRAYAVQGLDSGSIQVTDLGVAAQKAYLDDGGSNAILVSASGVQFVSELDKTPRVAAAVQLTSVTAVAFLQGQKCAVIATAESALYRLCGDRPSEAAWIRAIDSLRIDAMAHATGFGLVLMDRAANRLVALRGSLEAGAAEDLATAADGIDQPVAVMPLNAQEFLVALAGTSKAAIVSAKGVGGSIDLPATPDRLDLLVANRIIACTGMLDQPLLVIDLLQDRTPFFIPILRGGL